MRSESSSTPTAITTTFRASSEPYHSAFGQHGFASTIGCKYQSRLMDLSGVNQLIESIHEVSQEVPIRLVRLTGSVTVVAVILLSACAADRYRWNLTHQHLMPNASKLPRADIEEITRLVSTKSAQPILGIARKRTGPHAGEVTVATTYPGGNYPEDHGCYWLQKKAGHWRIVQGGPDLSGFANWSRAKGRLGLTNRRHSGAIMTPVGLTGSP